MREKGDMRKKRDIISEGQLKNRVTFKSRRQAKNSLKHPKLEVLSWTKDSLPVSDKEVFKTMKNLLNDEIKLTKAKIRQVNAKTRFLISKTIAVIVSTILGILTFIITVVLPQFFVKRYHQLRGVFEDKEFSKLNNEFCLRSR